MELYGFVPLLLMSMYVCWRVSCIFYFFSPWKLHKIKTWLAWQFKCLFLLFNLINLKKKRKTVWNCNLNVINILCLCLLSHFSKGQQKNATVWNESWHWHSWQFKARTQNKSLLLKKLPAFKHVFTCFLLEKLTGKNEFNFKISVAFDPTQSAPAPRKKSNLTHFGPHSCLP